MTLVSIADAGKGPLVPSGTMYTRRNVFGGENYYDRNSNRIGYSRSINHGTKFYNKTGGYNGRIDGNRVYTNPRFLGD
jgi:hypothetical protein